MRLSNTCRYCLQMIVREAAVITERINKFLEDDDFLNTNTNATQEQHHVRFCFQIKTHCYDDEEQLRLEAGLICDSGEFIDDIDNDTESEENPTNAYKTPSECYLEPFESVELNAEKMVIECDDEQLLVVSNLNDYMKKTETVSLLSEEDITLDEEISKPKETNVQVQNHGEVTEHNDHSDSQNVPPTERRPFKCIKCDKSFKRDQNLKQHSIIHSEIKPFICDVCGRGFRLKNTLVTHQALHYGKTIECADCDKKFARRSHLIIHSRTHRGERPFRCNYLNCEASYLQRALLVAHQQMHEGLRKYTCEKCGSAFYNRYGLMGHMHSVHSNYRYECEQCKKNFTKPFNIRKHLRNAHGIQIGSVAHLKKKIQETQPSTD